MRYTVITPVRNEAAHVGTTIASMVAQTLRPVLWAIVDDGSTDGTPAILDKAAAEHRWIKILHRKDRGFRKSGGGVIEAFYDGLALLSGNSQPSTLNSQLPPEPSTLNPQPALAWDFLVKLDADLQFEGDYFQCCLAKFAADPKLGIGGGLICEAANGTWTEETTGDPPFHVRGATKIYRRACWDSIGGLLKAPGWDTLDELKANKNGFTTYTFRDLKILQLKSTGTADGTWKNWVKNGRANYITGYHPLFMLLKCFKRTFSQPYGTAALGLLAGFLGGYLKREPRVPDRELIQYLRRQQINRLLGKPSLWS